MDIDFDIELAKLQRHVQVIEKYNEKLLKEK